MRVHTGNKILLMFFFLLFQESNFKLTQGIEEAIGKIEIKNRQIEELQLKIESDSRVMSEQVPVHEVFIFELFIMCSQLKSFQTKH